VSTRRTVTLKSFVRFSAPPEVTGMLSVIFNPRQRSSQMFIVVNARIQLLPASVYVEGLAAASNPFDCSILARQVLSGVTFHIRPSEARCAQFCTAATSHPVSVRCVPNASDRVNYFDLTCVFPDRTDMSALLVTH
jgi:hypothetical protein